MGVIASHGYGIPKPGVKGGWTASFGLGNYPWSVLLIKRSTSVKNHINASRLGDQVRVSETHLGAPVESLESSMNTGTSEPSLARSSESRDLDRSSSEGGMVYASREGTDEWASEVSETADKLKKYSLIQPDNDLITQDPAERDEDG